MQKSSLICIALSSFVASGYGADLQAPSGDRRPEPIISEASGDAELAASQVRVPEGLELSVWAAEPLFAHGVAFDIDNKGRFYIAESHRVGSSVIDVRGYRPMLESDMASRTVYDRAVMIEDMFGETASKFSIESEVIRFVEDTDHDGKADFSSIYADGFSTSVDGIGSGVLARKGEVYFTNIPHLWKFQSDSTGRKSTKRESLLYGFGIHFGFYGHDMHGLTMGPDGKLYFSMGDRGANVVNKEGKRVYFPDEGAVYRCNWDGSEFEIVHRGLRNPQELAFDELGNLLTGDNDCDNGDVERLVHVVEGGDSGWRIGHQYSTQSGGGVWIGEGWWKERFEGQAKFLLPPVTYINDGPGGIAYYPGTGLSPEYSGHLFIAHFKGNVTSSAVDSYTLKPKGASFELGERKPFLENILPTDVAFGPDGRFYVSDWVSGWGKSGRGRIFAVTDPENVESKLVKETQSLIANGFEDLKSKQLAKLLSHPNWNVRLESQYELADRGSESIAIFAKIAKSEKADLYSRLHATWGLGQLAKENLDTVSPLLKELIKSEVSEVRAHAAKLLGDHLIADTDSQLETLLSDENARVQFFAAQSLGKLSVRDAAPALLELARKNDDEDLYLRHAIIMGLVGGKNMEALEAAEKDSSKAVRTAVLLSYRRLHDARVATFLEDEDKELVLSAARAINDEGIEEAFPQLAAMINSPLAIDPILGDRALNAHFRIGGSENAVAVASYAVEEKNPESLRIEALTHLSGWAKPHPRDRVIGLYRPLKARDSEIARAPVIEAAGKLLASKSGHIQSETIKTLKELGITNFADTFYTLVMDDSQDERSRVAAFKSLEEQGDPRMEELVDFASQSDSSELRLATLPFLAKKTPDQAEASFALMIQGSVAERRAAYDALARSDQAYAEDLLAKSIEDLIAGDVPYAAQLELIEAAESSDSPRIGELLAKYNAAVAADPDPIAPYRFAIDGGSDGWSVYNQNEIMACVRCHIAYGPGKSAGPNLRSVGFKDREYLLESIVAPDAKIAHGFETTIVTKTDGTTLVGVFESEDEKQLVLRMADDSDKSIAKSEIASRMRTPSTMPDVFKTGLSRHDLRDIVEYISLLREDPNTSERSTHGEF